MTTTMATSTAFPATSPTLGLSSNASPRSLPTPQSPAPMALSEFMAQTRPSSDTSNPPSDKPQPPQDCPQLDAPEEPQQNPSPSPSPVEEEPTADSPPPTVVKTHTPPPPSPRDTPPPTDWLSTRQQLLPRRNQGKKADWIRGWSLAVGSHGDDAYCACSNTVDTSLHGRKGRTSDLAGNVRAILQRASSPANNTANANKPTTPEPDLCSNCARPTPPPPGAAGLPCCDPACDSSVSHVGRSFSKRVSALLTRVRAARPGHHDRRCKSAPRETDAETRKTADAGSAGGWPEACQPRWATAEQGQKRFLVRPPSQPVSVPAPAKSHSLDYFARHSHSRGKAVPGGGGGGGGGAGGGGAGGGAGVGPTLSELDGLSDSDVQRPAGLARSMSRLQRAAALLQRATSRPKD